MGITVTGKVLPSHVIGQDEDNIRFTVRRLSVGKSRCSSDACKHPGIQSANFCYHIQIFSILKTVEIPGNDNVDRDSDL
jgi:hypothetical protein